MRQIVKKTIGWRVFSHFNILEIQPKLSEIMSQRAPIELQIDAAYNQMDKVYPHAALPVLESHIDASVAYLPRTEKGMNMTPLSDKYKEDADLELLAAHSMIRLEKTKLVNTAMNQGLLETMVNLESADANRLSESLQREVREYEQRIEQVRTKIEQEHQLQATTEQFLHEKLREKIKEVLLQ